MQQTEVNDFLNALGSIGQGTEAGKLVWSQANESTFTWSTAPGSFTRLVIQKVSQMPPMYVLQAFDAQNRRQLNAIGAENSIVNLKLAGIFNSIEQIRDRKSLDFLKSIIPPA